MTAATSRSVDGRGERTFPVFLSLGSNIEAEKNLPRAVALLARRLPLAAVSRVYETEPVAAPGASPFLNAAVLVASVLAPRALKYDLLRPLEADLGRRRGSDPNAARTIDVDIALFDELILEDPLHHIEIPDPEILIRAHLALPLADLSAGTRHPLTGETLGEIAARFAGAPGVRERPDLLLVRNPG